MIDIETINLGIDNDMKTLYIKIVVALLYRLFILLHSGKGSKRVFFSTSFSCARYHERPRGIDRGEDPFSFPHQTMTGKGYEGLSVSILHGSQVYGVFVNMVKTAVSKFTNLKNSPSMGGFELATSNSINF